MSTVVNYRLWTHIQSSDSMDYGLNYGLKTKYSRLIWTKSINLTQQFYEK